MVSQLQFHIITVLHSSSAQIGNSFLLEVTCCYLSRKVEAVIQTTFALSFRACPLNNIIVIKYGFSNILVLIYILCENIFSVIIC